MRNKGFKHSQETREKMSASAKGKKVSVKTREKLRTAMIKIGHKPPNHTGRKLSKEHIESMRKCNLGKKMSEETRRKIGESASIRNRGANCCFWKGGISEYPYPTDWTETLRKAIRQRDNFMCQLCGTSQDELLGRFKQLSVHHIDYNKENCNPKNLVTLCNSCHVKTNSGRDYWEEYFLYEP